MKTKLMWILSGLLCALIIGCSQTKPGPEPHEFTELANAGKQVFQQHGCNDCHYVGDEEAKTDAPDLTDPILANDSLFVRNHLKFVELSKMPPIEMTDEEMRLVSHYIASLHASKQQTVSEDEADARCPVCFAPVSKERAEANNLRATFLDERYYFECADCLKIFKTAPEAFIELYEQYYNGKNDIWSSK